MVNDPDNHELYLADTILLLGILCLIFTVYRHIDLAFR